MLRVDYEACPEIIFSVGFGSGVETYREFYWGTIEDLGEDGRIMRGDTYSGDYFYPSRELVDFYEAIDGKPINESSYYKATESWKTVILVSMRHFSLSWMKSKRQPENR